MELSVVCYLIACSRGERKGTPVLEFGIEFSVQAKKNVPFSTPMVGDVARAVLNHTNANVSESTGLPVSHTPLP
mgnify:CR=1 FL=1|jgi:hypothetical protein|tara:strand:+ start:689 stop:910 length:222 start_codon:yes stop_codon:yes gene_type:complete